MSQDHEIIKLERFISGGQTIASRADGKKILVWGGLPGETVEIAITASKSHYDEALVEQVITPSPNRVKPRDPASYLATSPWQIVAFDAENRAKATLIDEAFVAQKLKLPGATTLTYDDRDYGYRGKVSYRFIGEPLTFAAHARGSHDKIALISDNLVLPAIADVATKLLKILRATDLTADQLGQLTLRANQNGAVSWILTTTLKSNEARQLTPQLIGDNTYGEIRNLHGDITLARTATPPRYLHDTLLGRDFRYSADSFFQINLPIYERALRDIQQAIIPDQLLLDLYSGVGTIGLSVGEPNTTLVESNRAAVREMRANIVALHSPARVVLSTSERVLQYITNDIILCVDPPRAGLARSVIARILDTQPPRIIYLSCNPVTQARDVKYLESAYRITAHQGYNFFPHTPHIEHLVILDRVA